jgi:imidazole glycerol-phosphate synthase subunit HisH
VLKIAVIDYGLGNTKSICSALGKTGADVCLTNVRDEIMLADGAILPGVGAFAHGMERLISQKIDTLIREFVSTGKPFLGICLGMQMLFDKSTEFGETNGLGLIPGQVQRLERFDGSPEKLPHVSWNGISTVRMSDWNGTILDSIDIDEDMYFVHSYFVKPASRSDILSVSRYSGHEYCSTVKRDNIYGCQYHPEKSAAAGLRVINNFVTICKG